MVQHDRSTVLAWTGDWGVTASIDRADDSQPKRSSLPEHLPHRLGNPPFGLKPVVLAYRVDTEGHLTGELFFPFTSLAVKSDSDTA